jgi:hypothetical protein
MAQNCDVNSVRQALIRVDRHSNDHNTEHKKSKKQPSFDFDEVEVTKEDCFLWGHYYCLGRWQWRVSAGSFFSPRRLPNQEPRTNVDPTDDAHHCATTASWYGS